MNDVTTVVTDPMLATRMMPVWVVGVTSSNSETENDEYQWNVRIAGVFLTEEAANEFRERIGNLDVRSQIGVEISQSNIDRLIAAGRINEFFGWNWCDIPVADFVREGDLADLTTWEGVYATALLAREGRAVEDSDPKADLFDWFQEWTYEQASMDYMYPMASGLYAWIEKSFMGGGSHER